METPQASRFRELYLRNRPIIYPATRMGLTEFSQGVFGLTNTAPMHKEWDRDLERIFASVQRAKGVKGYEDAERIRFGCIIAPPEHGKSFRSGIVFPIWALQKNPELRILNASSVEGQAERQVATAKRFIDTNYPNMRGHEKWSDLEFSVRRTGIYQEQSYTALNIMGGKIVGGHWDIILADDFVTLANSLTPYLRDKMARFIRLVLLGRLTPEGVLTFIGSRWHQQDFYDEITGLDGQTGEPKNPFWHSRFNPPFGFTHVHKAIQTLPGTNTWDMSIPFEKRVAWPSLIEGDGAWTWKDYTDRWELMGTILATLQLQNDPMLVEGNVLKAKWLQEHAYEDEELPDQRHRTEGCITIDPAFSTEEPGDWCAAAVGIMDTWGQVWLHDVAHWHVTFTDWLKDYLEPYYENWKEILGPNIPWRLRVETNAFGGYKEFQARVRMMQTLGIMKVLPLVPFTSTRNKMARFGTSAAYYENGSVRCRAKITVPGHPFHDEWVGFDKYDHDDCVDAADMLVTFLLRIGGITQPRAVQPKSLGRTSRRDRRRLYRAPGDVNDRKTPP